MEGEVERKEKVKSKLLYKALELGLALIGLGVLWKEVEG